MAEELRVVFFSSFLILPAGSQCDILSIAKIPNGTSFLLDVLLEIAHEIGGKILLEIKFVKV